MTDTDQREAGSPSAARPAQLVAGDVEHCLELAATWPAWDAGRGQAWTLREIAEHVANVSYYADQVGPLS